MKRPHLSIENTKKGVASLYTVIFATVLFGVITVSFISITLSETSQSSNDDLSRSAYDSAMAGVEDAKTAVNRYYNCLSSNSNADACAQYDVFSSASVNDCTNGFPLASTLYGLGAEDLKAYGGVPIRESSTDTEFASNQFYTCVLIKDITPDYRGTLTSDTRTKVIPMSVSRTTESGNDLSKVSKIRFEWFSELNQGSNTVFNLRADSTLPGRDNATVPPTVQLTFIKTHRTEAAVNGNAYNISSSAFDESMDNASDYSYIDSSMLLLPADGSLAESNEEIKAVVENGNILTIDKAKLVQAGNASKVEPNKPFLITCAKGREFACVAELEVEGIIKKGDNAFLVVSLPYADAYTDFAVTLLDNAGNQIDFEGAQISVDSTGKTDQLVRRVEVRLDPADIFFPYPQYAIEANGSDDDSIRKNFWITANCWSTNIPLSDGDKNGACNNNGELSSGT